MTGSSFASGLYFNGATTLSPWKRHWSKKVRMQAKRLQWSHDVIAVETLKGSTNQSLYSALQWSHDVIAVETLGPRAAK